MSWLRTAIKSIFYPWTMRQRRLASSRPRLSKREFVAATVASGGDLYAAEWIWQHLHDEWGWEKGFSPYPDDTLERIFGLAEEERDVDILTTLLNRLSLPLPTTEVLQEFGRIDTPAQIAQLIAEMRCRKEEADPRLVMS